MKILKIELQNLNSLKSDVPIVIDFEQDAFRDVGLFAITGSTGAGKTTILDAITIALYNQVARFRRSDIKAGLEDVVSFGASDALARLTFESKQRRYEAHWSMRLASKTGKVLDKPVEELRVKNLTTGEILASKKREVLDKIKEITMLDYDQFLRSVLLAQGEFAAFLSASANDKGALLEQLAGEPVYKRIGEAAVARIGEEAKKLVALRGRLNTDDLLSDEELAAVSTETTELTKALALLDTEIAANNVVLQWYRIAAVLDSEQVKLDIDSLELGREFAEQQHILDALALHDLAMPLKDVTETWGRIDTEMKTKRAEFENSLLLAERTQAELQALQPVLLEQETAVGAASAESERWQPILEQVAKLDSEIGIHQKRTGEMQQLVKQIATSLENYKRDEAASLQILTKAQSALVTEASYLQQHSAVKQIEAKLGEWTTELSLRKRMLDDLAFEQLKIEKADANLTILRIETETANANLNSKSADLDLLQTDFSLKSEALTSFQSADFLTQHTALESACKQLEMASNLALTQAELSEIQHKSATVSAELLAEILSLKERIKNGLQKIATSEESVADQARILDLEKRFVSFEAERSKLKPHDPCMLCGATDHPFVTNYHTVAVSETEAKLQQRKAELQKLTTLLRNLELDAATKQTRLDAEIGQQAELVRKSEKCRADFKALSIGFQIEAPILIQAELALKRTALAACKEQILQQQKLQLAKDKAQQSLQNATETVATLRTEAKLLQEKSTNLAAQLDQLRTETQQLTQELQTKEVALQQDFGVFQFALPKPDETTEFLKLRKTEIENFHKAEQKINDLQHKIDKVSLERTHLEASVQQKNGELIATNNDLLTLHAIIDTALIKREALLPNQISTDSKRSELHSKLQQYAGVLSQTKSTWDASHKQHTEHSTKLELLRIDIEQLTPKLHAAWQQLQAEYMPTQFTTVQEVIAAILPQTVLVSHLGIFQKLHETRLSLKTRLTQLTQKRAELLCSKDFECAQSEAEQTAETQKSEKARIHTRQGELNHKLQLDAEIKRRNQGIVAEIELQDAHHSLWKTLLELLGGTKDSFNKYVQRLTLHNLIQLANIHLAKLNRRYSLYMPSMSKGGEELNFVLVDHYQTDQCRSIETSSGGEKFLISLALALGLSDLASKNVHIGSLFIDEGFGTLDQQTLQTVITTLETLQASGKMIGVISHVENMKERIGTQIQILKKSNGVSELKIV